MMTSGAICGETGDLSGYKKKTLISWEVVGGMYSAPSQKVNELMICMLSRLYILDDGEIF